ncbi:Tn3 family transposase [Nonomuraea jabiensis]|uniref:Tn3 family transposase n=1 Tax=Nonomuraea jabiensis TaxID=882448 RepID=UPI003D717B00
MSATVDQLRAQGVPVKDEDVARLSPLGHAHLNCLGRYAIASSAPRQGSAAAAGSAAAPGRVFCRRGRGRGLTPAGISVLGLSRAHGPTWGSTAMSWSTPLFAS